jgi:hypothetical protein
LNVGGDPAEPVTDDYPGTSRYASTEGTIKEAIVGGHPCRVMLDHPTLWQRLSAATGWPTSALVLRSAPPARETSFR